MAERGSVDVTAAKLIRTAAKSLMFAMLYDRKLRLEGPSVDAVTFNGMADRAAKFEESADRAIRALNLQGAKTEQERLYEMLYAPLPTHAVDGPPDAAPPVGEPQAGLGDPNRENTHS